MSKIFLCELLWSGGEWKIEQGRISCEILSIDFFKGAKKYIKIVLKCETNWFEKFFGEENNKLRYFWKFLSLI